MVTLVAVKLTQRLQVKNGGLLHPGEVVGLPAAEAEDLIARGGATPIHPQETAMSDDSKKKPVSDPVKRAPDVPPADKMQRAGGVVKK